MASSQNSFPCGIHIDAAKEATSGLPIRIMPAPDTVYLPLAMHIGAPAEPLVTVGDSVKLGQRIAAARGFVSSNIHASVSGKVTGFERRFLPSGAAADCIVIKNDGLDTLSEDISPRSHTDLSPDALRQIFLDKGVVGMGGATFPTHVKYAPPKADQRKIDTVILNGIECEPYITADHRVMLEQAEDVISGLKYFMQAAGVNRGIIAIEDNKPDAIDHLKKLAAADSPSISICVCPEKYPQGSEKQLIYAATGRVVPRGALPAAVGVIVDNVATAVQAALAVNQDLPCYQRIVTVSGNGVNRPGNYLIRLGTLYSQVVETAAQGINGDLARIISGGPMMGFSLRSLDFPVMKGTSGLLLFNQESPFANTLPEQTCVRCGRCVDICPMFLQPTVIAKAVKRKDWSAAQATHISSCIECGTCTYNCPSHIPLVQYIRMGKQFIATDGSGGHNPYLKK